MDEYVCTTNTYEIKSNKPQMTYLNQYTQKQKKLEKILYLLSTELELKVNELKARVKLLEEELMDKKGLIEQLLEKQKANGKQDNRE